MSIKSNYLQNETSNSFHSHLGVIPEVNKMIQYLLLMFIEENEVSWEFCCLTTSLTAYIAWL